MNGLRKTDMGNSEMLVKECGHLIRWDGRKWWLWSGKQWLPGGDSMVEKLAKQTVKKHGGDRFRMGV